MLVCSCIACITSTAYFLYREWSARHPTLWQVSTTLVHALLKYQALYPQHFRAQCTPTNLAPLLLLHKAQLAMTSMDNAIHFLSFAIRYLQISLLFVYQIVPLLLLFCPRQRQKLLQSKFLILRLLLKSLWPVLTILTLQLLPHQALQGGGTLPHLQYLNVMNLTAPRLIRDSGLAFRGFLDHPFQLLPHLIWLGQWSSKWL